MNPLNLRTQIKEASQEVYNALQSGFSEAVYHKAMEAELRIRGILYSTKATTEIRYKGFTVGFCEPDLVVPFEGGEIIVELKATTYHPRASEIAQLQSYLRLRKTQYGILINFPQPCGKRTKIEKVDWIEYGFSPESSPESSKVIIDV